MQTILITGCSSGFGLEMARHFLERNWNVIATMRDPAVNVLPESDRLQVLALDVTDETSIRRVVEMAGPVDALVNNAGFGVGMPFELIPPSLARELFETNTIGTMALTQAFLPQFRARRAGVIVNVTSSVTLKSLPVVSLYRASKAAVNAFTESMAIELAPSNIRAHLVLPGRSPETKFADNAQMGGLDHEAYAEIIQPILTEMLDESGPVTYAKDVAEAVWRAVTDPSSPLRIPAGADAIAWSEEARSADIG